MKKNIFAALCLMSAISTAAVANVTVNSSVEFDFSNFDSAPAPYFYGYSGNNYGYHYSVDTSPGGAWTLMETFQLDSITYQDERTGGYGAVKGIWSNTTGSGVLSLVGVDNNPGLIATALSLGMGNPFRFLGPFVELPEFSYSFNVNGTKQFESEFIGAAVQLELGYVYYDDAAARWVDVRMYSDYGDYGYGFRDNWVYQISDSGNSNLSFSESGIRTFNGFSTLDQQERFWFIEYGFSAVGLADNGNDGASVPEPATLVLLGLGLAGLYLARRRG